MEGRVRGAMRVEGERRLHKQGGEVVIELGDWSTCK
jgi:hypothetical protein